jgi:hypothetical protein
MVTSFFGTHNKRQIKEFRPWPSPVKYVEKNAKLEIMSATLTIEPSVYFDQIYRWSVPSSEEPHIVCGSVPGAFGQD